MTIKSISAKEGDMPLPEKMFIEARGQAQVDFEAKMAEIRNHIGTSNPELSTLLDGLRRAHEIVLISTHYRWVADKPSELKPEDQPTAAENQRSPLNALPDNGKLLSQVVVGHDVPDELKTAYSKLKPEAVMGVCLEVLNKSQDPQRFDQNLNRLIIVNYINSHLQEFPGLGMKNSEIS